MGERFADDVVLGELPLVGRVTVVALGDEEALVVHLEHAVDDEHPFGSTFGHLEHHDVADVGCRPNRERSTMSRRSYVGSIDSPDTTTSRVLPPSIAGQR